MLEGYVLKDVYFWGYIETILNEKDWLKLFFIFESTYWNIWDYDTNYWNKSTVAS